MFDSEFLNLQKSQFI